MGKQSTRGILMQVSKFGMSRAPKLAALVGAAALAVLALTGCQSGSNSFVGTAATAAPSASATVEPLAAASTSAPSPAASIVAPEVTTPAPVTPVAPATTPAYIPPPVPAYTPPPAPATTLPPVPAGDGSYTNVDGNTIPDPVSAAAPPAGATAQCNDGTYSFSQHHSGTCSGHGGVAQWL